MKLFGEVVNMMIGGGGGGINNRLPGEATLYNLVGEELRLISLRICFRTMQYNLFILNTISFIMTFLALIWTSSWEMCKLCRRPFKGV